METITQLQMINALRSIAQKDDNVSAVLMYGSFTKDEGDIYSDIEFYIFLKSKEFFCSENWVSQIHPLNLYFINEHGSEVAIFENMIRGEFHFLPTNEINVIKSWEGLVEFSEFEKMNLVDKEGLLANTLNQIKIKRPNRKTEENILWLCQSLLNVLLTTSNLIKRHEFAHAHQSLAGTQKYLLWLIRIAANQTQHWESPTKNLETDIDNKRYSEFQSSTSSLDAEDIKTAFHNSLKLSERLFRELKVGLPLTNLLDKIE